MIHPWNQALFHRLADRARMPHALLIHGRAGLGKLALARSLGQWLLCESPASDGPCSVCDACNWFGQGNHPDYRQVEPREEEVDESGKVIKKASKIIDVESIRGITGFLELSSHRGGWRVAVIHPAEYLNAAAANALLKTLEEPPPQVLLMLVCHQPGRLLPTVVSRCRQVPVLPPGEREALAWLMEAGVESPASVLAEAGGAPLTALGYADFERSARRNAFLNMLADPDRLDASQGASAHQAFLTDAWGWLSRWLADLLSIRLAGQARYFRERAESATRLAGRAELAGLLDFQQELNEAARWLRHPLNAQLLLESWLIRYVQVTRGKP